MNKTNIAWTDLSWNLWSGCKKISTECKFCYAHQLAEQKRGTRAFPGGFDLTLRPHKLKEVRRPKAGALIFVNSMSDFWLTAAEMGRPELEDDLQILRHQAIDAMESRPDLNFQVLTKRPENIARQLGGRRLPDNFWAGVTCGHKEQVGRLDILRRSLPYLPIRFVSAEPLLTPLADVLDLTGFQWLISGGESGTHLMDSAIREKRGLAGREGKGRWFPREDRIQWVRDIRDLCLSSGVDYFHKQFGGVRPHSSGRILDGMEWTNTPEPMAELEPPQQLSFAV